MNRTQISFSRHNHPWVFATAVTFGLAVLTAGCSFLQPAKSESHYYLLAPANPPAVAGHTNAGPAFAVRLRPVELAEFLNTRDMAVRTGENEIRFALYHRWAEPLDAGIRRVLAANLRAEPTVRAVLTDQAPPPHFPVYTISVYVLSCEGASTNHVGSAMFEAFWEITGPDPRNAVIGQGVFRAAPASWTPGDYGQLARELSRALADFGSVLVDTISRHGSTVTAS